MTGSDLPGAPSEWFDHQVLYWVGQIVTMVGVAQLVELRIVIPAVVGSSPIVHPIFEADLSVRIG